ncbi:hypothetical protein [Streptomyces sp. NPDC048577]|uniref:hypothetical protein n=1 Tax=Streptomyces sp. NPDC048577 TaxID=3157209 RepID=UPI003419D691
MQGSPEPNHEAANDGFTTNGAPLNPEGRRKKEEGRSERTNERVKKASPAEKTSPDPFFKKRRKRKERDSPKTEEPRRNKTENGRTQKGSARKRKSPEGTDPKTEELRKE